MELKFSFPSLGSFFLLYSAATVSLNIVFACSASVHGCSLTVFVTLVLWRLNACLLVWTSWCFCKNIVGWVQGFKILKSLVCINTWIVNCNLVFVVDNVKVQSLSVHFKVYIEVETLCMLMLICYVCWSWNLCMFICWLDVNVYNMTRVCV